MLPLISLVVARDRQGVIGVNGELPWDLPDDLAHFRRVTQGKPIIMGRKTYESIGHPLPGRRNVVITRQIGRTIPGCTVVGSLPEAIAAASEGDPAEIYVIGGGEIYVQALPLADQLIVTEVHADVEAAGEVATFTFPEEEWESVDEVFHPADDRHEYGFTIVNYQRRRGS